MKACIAPVPSRTPTPTSTRASGEHVTSGYWADMDDSGVVRPFLIGLTLPCLVLLSGCGLATLPVKATSKAVDWTTTSQDEADRNRGRNERKRDEAYERCMRDGREDC